jgi:flavin reductase (DIM6/NTAB) family NADH-FMN oxidoreductase RutF
MEFVINIPTEKILEKLWITAEKFPDNINEIEKANLTQIPSKKISTPQIEECVAHIECKVNTIQETGDHHLILGEVVYLDVVKTALKNGFLNVVEVKPILHVGGVYFVVGDKLRKVK